MCQLACRRRLSRNIVRVCFDCGSGLPRSPKLVATACLLQLSFSRLRRRGAPTLTPHLRGKLNNLQFANGGVNGGRTAVTAGQCSSPRGLHGTYLRVCRSTVPERLMTGLRPDMSSKLSKVRGTGPGSIILPTFYYVNMAPEDLLRARSTDQH